MQRDDFNRVSFVTPFIALATVGVLDVLDYGVRSAYRFARWLDTIRHYQRRGRCPVCGYILTTLKEGIYRCQECHGK